MRKCPFGCGEELINDGHYAKHLFECPNRPKSFWSEIWSWVYELL